MSVPDSSQYISSVKGRANSEFKVALGKNGPKANSIAAAIQYSNVQKGLQFSSKIPPTVYTITIGDIAFFDDTPGNETNGGNTSPIIKIGPGGLLLDNKSGQTVWCLYYDSKENLDIPCSTANGILNNSSYTKTGILESGVRTIPQGYLLINPMNLFFVGGFSISIQ